MPIRIGEHTDFGIFTFLLLGEHGAEGLQLKRVQGGEVCVKKAKEEDMLGWSDVVVPPGVGAVMNTGALMVRWTNDTWTATAHRVIVSNEPGWDRYSIACFIDPDRDCLVKVHGKFQEGGPSIKYEPITSFDYLMMKLSVSEMMPKE